MGSAALPIRPIGFLEDRAGETQKEWRSGRDLNPRYAFTAYDSLANYWFKPLTHHSVAVLETPSERTLPRAIDQIKNRSNGVPLPGQT